MPSTTVDLQNGAHDETCHWAFRQKAVKGVPFRSVIHVD